MNEIIDFMFPLMEVAAVNGVASLTENPENAYLWQFPAAQNLLDAGCNDWNYHGCCLSAVRKKKQRIRSQVEELFRGRDPNCRHVHDEHEWDPVKDPVTGRFVYPTRLEAEYTAALVFHIVVATSY